MDLDNIKFIEPEKQPKNPLHGVKLADIIENQYSILQNLGYYVGLMTQLWFAPDSIEGKKDMQEGFRQHIINGIQEAIEYHPYVIQKITDSQKINKH